MELKDSGVRREFDTGAVRDIADGKGRCDLLPLEIICKYFNYTDPGHDIVLVAIESYIRTGNEDFLHEALVSFVSRRGWDKYTAMLEVSKHYEDGARKYSDRNWERGIPLHCYINSGVRHYLKYLRGDTDEPHDRAFLWNMLGALWTAENKPEMVDLPFAGKEGDNG